FKHFAAISVFFILPLTLYLYLPIRTEAGAAIHWGDPDNIERFLAHVTATAHRGAYVFSAGFSQYLSRLSDALRVLALQYGILTLFSIWGWIGIKSLRWKIFFAGVILFDLFYTVFLNIISLEITPFTLPTSIVLAILMGMGLNDFLGWARRRKEIGSNMKKGIAAAFCIIPLVALVANYSLCDQSRNYTAYDHAVNIFRTADHGGAIFLDGDNNLFPVVYGRIAEGMGEGTALYDRHNIIFKWSPEQRRFNFEGTGGDVKLMMHKKIAREAEKRGVYFAVFNPYAVPIPNGFHLVPYGILRKLVPDQGSAGTDNATNVWDHYYSKSFHDDFERDYMSREVCSFYFFRKGENLWRADRTAESLAQLRIASRIGYNDTAIHSEIGLFLTDRGFFHAARSAFEKALLYHDDLSGIHNNWGYYYHKTDDYKKAMASFSEAIALSPRNTTYHNNMGLISHKAGNKEEARLSFKKSLSINNDQPKIKAYMETHGLR
ncbi:MAG: tetratricopeptide repeat protein, partial [Deltaproteobacteria bacterium]|nr:tetratricopeptide repeat protein [Deltaproteobacteria bacterium]